MLKPALDPVGPGLDVAELETPHQQDERQEDEHDHQVDGEADHQPELVERRLVRARLRRQPASDRGFREAALRADRARRQEADIGRQQDRAGDDHLYGDEGREPDIAEQRYEDDEAAEPDRGVTQPAAPRPPRALFVAQKPDEDEQQPDDDGRKEASRDGQRERRSHRVVDDRQEVVGADHKRHRRRKHHEAVRGAANRSRSAASSAASARARRWPAG